MFLTLLLTSVLSGLVATLVMVMFLYLPLLWNGQYYDTLGAIGSVFSKSTDGRSRLIGAIILAIGGILFAVFYGAFVLMFEQGPFNIPHYSLFPNWPIELNFVYVFLGLAGGVGQGMFMSLITSFIVTDFHPVAEYRDNITLIKSYIIGHAVYGAVVMFFQSQLISLFLN